VLRLASSRSNVLRQKTRQLLKRATLLFLWPLKPSGALDHI
jgi:hypothetical protein